MKSTVFCNHYRAMSEHETCKAGVEYSTFQGMGFDERPCFANRGEPAHPGCDLVQLPTVEQLAERDAEVAKRMDDLGAARQAIVKCLGGPWKKGTPGASGATDCPVCGTKNALGFSRAGYNGHIHANCVTPGCVSWME